MFLGEIDIFLVAGYILDQFMYTLHIEEHNKHINLDILWSLVQFLPTKS